MSRGYWRNFRNLDPATAREVHDFVEAARRRFYKVEGALMELGQRLGFRRSKGFRLLRAGRYLKRMEA